MISFLPVLSHLSESSRPFNSLSGCLYKRFLLLPRVWADPCSGYPFSDPDVVNSCRWTCCSCNLLMKRSSTPAIPVAPPSCISTAQTSLCYFKLAFYSAAAENTKNSVTPITRTASYLDLKQRGAFRNRQAAILSYYQGGSLTQCIFSEFNWWKSIGKCFAVTLSTVSSFSLKA